MTSADEVAARRQRVLDRTTGPADLPDTIQCAVVGMTFVDGYPGNVRALDRLLNEDAWENEMTRLSGVSQRFEPEVAGELRRDPANTHDANAVQVHVTALDDGSLIGHLPRAVAARLAPELDNGHRWSCTVTEVYTHSEHVDHPGVTVRLARVPFVSCGDPRRDLVTEAVAGMKWAEIDWELRIRDLEPSADDAENRARVVDVLLAEPTYRRES